MRTNENLLERLSNDLLKVRIKVCKDESSIILDAMELLSELGIKLEAGMYV